MGGEDRKLTAAVVDPYSAGGHYPFEPGHLRGKRDWPSCAGFDGVNPGSVLRLRTVDTELYGETCDGLVARVESGPPELTLGTNVRSGDAFLSSVYDVQLGTCRGVWGLWFETTTSGSIFSVPARGFLPVILAIREFQPYASDTASQQCAPCSDAFVVQLSKGH